MVQHPGSQFSLNSKNVENGKNLKFENINIESKGEDFGVVEDSKAHNGGVLIPGELIDRGVSNTPIKKLHLDFHENKNIVLLQRESFISNSDGDNSSSIHNDDKKI